MPPPQQFLSIFTIKSIIFSISLIQLIFGIWTFVDGMTYINDYAYQQGFATYVPSPELIITEGIIAIVTAISGFLLLLCKVKSSTFASNLLLSFVCFVTSIVYFIWAISDFFPYMAFVILIASIFEMIMSINLYKMVRDQDDVGGYQRYQQNRVQLQQQQQQPQQYVYQGQEPQTGQLVQGVNVPQNQPSEQNQQQQNYIPPPEPPALNNQMQKQSEVNQSQQLIFQHSGHVNYEGQSSG